MRFAMPIASTVIRNRRTIPNNMAAMAANTCEWDVSVVSREVGFTLFPTIGI